jgi:hypothetical protein
MTITIRSIGVSWYTPEAWRELCAHPEAEIEKTYAEYTHATDRLIAGFTAQGFRVVKEPIDIAQMTAWCHMQGYEIDGKGRAAFGAVLQCCRNSGDDIMTVPFTDDSPSLSVSQCFSRIFSDTANAELAAKAHRRPNASDAGAYPFPTT